MKELTRQEATLVSAGICPKCVFYTITCYTVVYKGMVHLGFGPTQANVVATIAGSGVFLTSAGFGLASINYFYQKNKGDDKEEVRDKEREPNQKACHTN